MTQRPTAAKDDLLAKSPKIMPGNATAQPSATTTCDFTSMTKICKQCGIEKDISEFYARKESRDGFFARCKSCISKQQKHHRDKVKSPEAKARTKQKQRERDQKPENKEKKRQAARQVKRIYGPKQKEQKALYYLEHLESEKARHRAYVTSHRQDLSEKRRGYRERRVRTDVGFRLAQSLRSRFHNVLKGKTKSGSSVRDLGCSLGDLKIYLESAFRTGMTWENYGHGKGKWNIDHIMPLAAFDLTDRQHVLLACSYLNLQPLWHEENMAKNDTYPNLPKEYNAA
jgi:hypothetical protein